MKFKNITPFRSGSDIEKYLANTQRLGLLDLVQGLQSLRLLDNFEAFEYEGTLAAGTEQEIVNELEGFIPTSRIILRNNGDVDFIIKGDGEYFVKSDMITFSGEKERVRIVFSNNGVDMCIIEKDHFSNDDKIVLRGLDCRVQLKFK